MAHVRREILPYYPPRARWYSPALNLRDQVVRALALDRLHSPTLAGMDARQLLGAFLVPGLGFYFRSPRLIGKAALAASALLILSFLAFLGYTAANLAFGLLLSLHVSGFVYFCPPLARRMLSRRILFTLASLVAITFLIYFPARSFLQNYLFTPLQMNDQVIVVGHLYSMRGLRAGDWIAHSVAGSGGYEEGAVYTHAGVDFSPVLAIPGDLVTFSRDDYSVNGEPHPRLAYMPTRGSFRLGEKEWFVWPRLAISVHYGNSAPTITAMLLTMSHVTETELIGTPFQRWFGRKQILP